MAGKRGKSPRSAPRAALNVGTSAKDRKGIFAPHLIIPAAYLVQLSFGRAQSRQWFALDRVDVVHGFAGAFHQRLRGGAQGSEGSAIERAEECVVDRTDLGAEAVDLEPAGRLQCEQYAATVLRIGPLEQQSEPRHLAGLRGDEGARYVHGLGDRADPDATFALQMSDRDQHAVLRSAESHASAQMRTNDLHTACDREEIIDERPKPTVRALIQQRAGEDGR